jgi:hypothetical protein
MNAMVPLVTGWVMGVFVRETKEIMKVIKIQQHGVDAFEITFASGTVVRVDVSCVKDPEGK